MTNPTLAELNRHLFAAMLPETHALENTKPAKPGKKASLEKPADPVTDPAAPTYTAEQLATLAALGISDPSTKTAEEIAAILSAVK